MADDLGKMMAGQDSDPERQSSALGTVAIIFAVLFPIVGLVLGIIAISRRTGRARTKGIVATVIASVLILVVMVIAIASAGSSGSSNGGESPSPRSNPSPQAQLTTPAQAAAKARAWLEAEIAATPGAETTRIDSVECRPAPIRDAVAAYILSSWRCAVDSSDQGATTTNIVDVTEDTGGNVHVDVVG